MSGLPKALVRIIIMRLLLSEMWGAKTKGYTIE